MCVVAALERDCDFRKDACAALAGEIIASCEREAIEAWRSIESEILAAAVFVGFTARDFMPAVVFLLFQAHRNAGGGRAW